MTATTAVKTTGAVWNRFYSDPKAWPDGAYHDDTVLSINGKEEPDAELEKLAPDATVEIRCGFVILPNGSDTSMSAHFMKWQTEQAGAGVSFGSFRVSKDKLESVRLAVLAAGGELID